MKIDLVKFWYSDYESIHFFFTFGTWIILDTSMFQAYVSFFWLFFFNLSQWQCVINHIGITITSYQQFYILIEKIVLSKRKIIHLFLISYADAHNYGIL